MTATHESPGKDLAYLVECQLATLERLRDIKRTPKSELSRQESIAKFGIRAAALYCTDEDLRRGVPRLREAVEGLKAADVS